MERLPGAVNFIDTNFVTFVNLQTFHTNCLDCPILLPDS